MRGYRKKDKLDVRAYQALAELLGSAIDELERWHSYYVMLRKHVADQEYPFDD